MAPKVAALGQSEIKVHFFERLGLNIDDTVDCHLYAIMRQEAVTGRDKIISKRECLKLRYRDDVSVQPPYNFKQVRKSAIHAGVLDIYDNARKETRPIYELGHEHNPDCEDNWIIRWLIWHVFRYRDGGGQSCTATSSKVQDSSARDATARITYSRHYDPVRDVYTTVQQPKSPSERLAKAFESAHRLFEPEVPKTSSYPGIAQTLEADAAQNAQDVRFKLGRVDSASRPVDCRCTTRDTHSTLDLSQRDFLSTSWQRKPSLGDGTKASELGGPFWYLDPSVGNSNNQKTYDLVYVEETTEDEETPIYN